MRRICLIVAMAITAVSAVACASGLPGSPSLSWNPVVTNAATAKATTQQIYDFLVQSGFQQVDSSQMQSESGPARASYRKVFTMAPYQDSDNADLCYGTGGFVVLRQDGTSLDVNVTTAGCYWTVVINLGEGANQDTSMNSIYADSLDKLTQLSMILTKKLSK